MQLAQSSTLPNRKRLYVGMLIVAGCALLMWRPSFPYWMRPEYYEQMRVTEFASELQIILRGREDINGSRILVVGDSMVALWPWDADVISVPAGYPLALRDKMEMLLDDQHYDMIIIWVGTAYIAHRRSWRPLDPEEYYANVAAIVETAERFTDRPIIITPMEISGIYYAGISDTLPLRMACQVFDSRGIRPVGGRSLFMRDNFHLSPAGFSVLAEQLAEHDIHVQVDAGLTASAS